MTFTAGDRLNNSYWRTRKIKLEDCATDSAKGFKHKKEKTRRLVNVA